MCPPSLRNPRAATILALVVVAVFLGGAGELEAAGNKKRDPSIAIRFHAEVSVFDPQFTVRVKLGSPPRELLIEKIPSISEHDIISFYPYQAADGSYSAVLQLDRHGAASLENLSAQKIGRSIVAAINGRPVVAMRVDKPIGDGVIFIPYGLTLADIHAMGASFSIMGQPDNIRKGRSTPKPTSTPAPLDDGALPARTTNL